MALRCLNANAGRRTGEMTRPDERRHACWRADRPPAPLGLTLTLSGYASWTSSSGEGGRLALLLLGGENIDASFCSTHAIAFLRGSVDLRGSFGLRGSPRGLRGSVNDFTTRALLVELPSNGLRIEAAASAVSGSSAANETAAGGEASSI